MVFLTLLVKFLVFTLGRAQSQAKVLLKPRHPDTSELIELTYRVWVTPNSHITKTISF